MKIVLVCLILSGFGSCTNTESTIVKFDSPDRNKHVKIEIFDQGARLEVAHSLGSSKGYSLPWILMGEGYSRAWVGWSKDAKRISVVACSEAGIETIRRSVSTSGAIDINMEREAFAESDARLLSSLKKVQSQSEEARFRAMDTLAWFCEGPGSKALDRFRSSKERGEVFVVPYNFFGEEIQKQQP